MAASIRLTAVKKTDRSEGPRNCRRAWNYDLTNADKEYSHIHLRPRDMLKLGVLFAQDGRWHGKQVISSAWVHASLAEPSHVDDVSYGYFWWRLWLNVALPPLSSTLILFRRSATVGRRSMSCPTKSWLQCLPPAATTQVNFAGHNHGENYSSQVDASCEPCRDILAP